MIPFVIAATAMSYWSNAFELFDQYDSFVIIKYLILTLCFQGWLIDCRRGIMYRSMIAVMCIACWLDLIGYIVSIEFGCTFQTAYPLSILMFLWILYIIRRRYSTPSKPLSKDNVSVLILKPRTVFEVIKSLIGFPASSICITANGDVWAFRRKSETFEKFKATPGFLSLHIFFDTGMPFTARINNELSKLVGKKRFPPIKCVWMIRNVLSDLNIKPRWYEYIPAIYALRLIK